LAVDQNFKITKNDINDINKSFDQLPKKNGQILAVDRNFKITKNDINKILINYQNPSVLFRRLVKLIIKNFDRVKSLKNFGQLIMKISIN